MMSDHKPRAILLTQAQIDYLRKFPSTLHSADVAPWWPQVVVPGGVVARSCDGMNHEEVMGCWAFYPSVDEAGDAKTKPKIAPAES
jgi:hypothetical protein